jgi:predicted secreted hydrolase
MRSSIVLAALLASASGASPATSTSTSAASAAWRPADPAHRWRFPRDHHAHPGYRNEWWYLTGTLAAEGDPARRFGYQLTFFRVGLLPEPPDLDSAWAASDAVMGHLAVTDVVTGAHVFSEVIWRAVPLLGGFPAEPDPLLAWARAPPGTDGRWTLALEGGAFRLSARDEARGVALDLAARPTKPVALQGPNGLSRKSADGGHASLYLSLTRLATEGTLSLGGRGFRVRGESWMDEERGSSQLAPDQVGWDWFSLRLADGRDLMLYVLRRADGSASWRTGTLVERDGSVRLLPAETFSIRATGSWTSKASGAIYPSGWTVEVPGEGIRVEVVPEVRAAENRSAILPALSYWEGPVRLVAAGGAPAGEGYVELTGYAKGARLPL